jgi:SAM-dependent methyltransferase
MSEFYDFVFKDLDLRNKLILDAALGSGEATYLWAKNIVEQGGTSKIISIDTFDIPGMNEEEWKEKIKERLGKYNEYVDIKKADIFYLDFLDNESIDIINCDDTLVFLNPKPLKLLSVFKNFYRILKTSGKLIITSEIPVKKFDNPDNEGQWRRWNLAKAIYNLKGEIWSSEPLPKEVKFALECIDFKVYDEKIFPEKKNFKYQNCMDEWREIMFKDVEKLHWSDIVKNILRKEIDGIYNKVLKDGYLMNPALYVLKCIKE